MPSIKVRKRLRQKTNVRLLQQTTVRLTQKTKDHPTSGSSRDQKTKAPSRKLEGKGTAAQGRKSAKRDKEPWVVAKIIDHHRCPITHQLMVDPVIAEDGHIYERRALEQWLLMKETSPVTNKPMKPGLLTATLARKVINELVEDEVLDDKALQEFFIGRARLRATSTTGHGPDLAGASADLQRAAEISARAGDEQHLSTHSEILASIQRLVELFGRATCEMHVRQQMEDWQWLMDLANAARVALIQPLAKRITSHCNLPEGQRVRIIDCAAEVQRLCERPPQGATKSVGWVSDMATMVGQICIVDATGDEAHKNYCLRLESAPESRGFSFPFDAVMLLP